MLIRRGWYAVYGLLVAGRHAGDARCCAPVPVLAAAAALTVLAAVAVALRPGARRRPGLARPLDAGRRRRG